MYGSVSHPNLGRRRTNNSQLTKRMVSQDHSTTNKETLPKPKRRITMHTIDKYYFMVLRTAVVGAGVVSGTHLTALRRCPKTTPVAVCDIDEERATKVAREHNTTAYFDIDELLSSEQLHWLHICTPVQTHVTLARKAMESGVPVLIEKPITETSDELDELIEISEENDVVLSSVHNHVFDPAMRKARKLIDEGVVGKIRGVDLTYTGTSFADEPNRGSWTFELSGGEFEEGIPHPLYIALTIGGYPKNDDDIDIQTALTKSYEQPFSYDSVMMQYPTVNGGLSSIRVSAGGVPQHQLSVHGDRSSLLIDLISQTVVRIRRDYTTSSINRARNNLDRAVGRVMGTANMVQDVLSNRFDSSWESEKALKTHFYQIDAEANALLRGDQQPVPIEQAQWVIRMMELIRDAANETEQAKPQQSSTQQQQQ